MVENIRALRRELKDAERRRQTAHNCMGYAGRCRTNTPCVSSSDFVPKSDARLSKARKTITITLVVGDLF